MSIKSIYLFNKQMLQKTTSKNLLDIKSDCRLKVYSETAKLLNEGEQMLY